jgi:hypothetical protein
VTSLVLPRLASGIPGSIPWNRTGTPADSRPTLVDLAEKLLDLGVLRSSDWSGNLEDSVAIGFTRWIEEFCGARGMHCFGFWGLAFADADAGPVELHSPSWCNQFIGMPVDHGGFVFVEQAFDNVTSVTCGDAIEAVERHSNGAGYALLALIDEVIDLTGISIATPKFVYGAGRWAGTFGNGDFSEEEFFTEVPRAAVEHKYGRSKKSSILKANDLITEETSLVVRNILEVAVKLVDKCDEARRQEKTEMQGKAERAGGLGHRHWSRCSHDLPSTAVRWSKNDWTFRILDDYIEQTHEAGVMDLVGEDDEAFSVLTVRFFDARLPDNHPGSLATALRSVRLISELMMLTDQLLFTMNEESQDWPLSVEVRI